MINNEEKLYLINLKLDFWKELLLKSNQAIPVLNDLGNQLKVDSNLQDISRYTEIIYLLEEEKQSSQHEKKRKNMRGTSGLAGKGCLIDITKL